MYIDENYLSERFGVERSAPEKRPKRAKKAKKPSMPPGGKEGRKEFEDSPEAAFSQLERWIVRRDYSKAEAASKLARKGFGPSSISMALDRASRCGYLDDTRYAESLIRSRLAQGKGLAGVERTLSDFGISVDSIPGYPDEFLEDAPSQIELALELLNRKPPRSKNLRQGAYAKLLRNGFSSSVAAKAAAHWTQSHS